MLFYFPISSKKIQGDVTFQKIRHKGGLFWSSSCTEIIRPQQKLLYLLPQVS